MGEGFLVLLVMFLMLILMLRKAVMRDVQGVSFSSFRSVFSSNPALALNVFAIITVLIILT